MKTSYVVARNHLARERLAAGIAEPSELAARAGIDPGVYEHIEAGDMLPTKEQLGRLRAALGDIPQERLYSNAMLQLMGAVYYGSPDRTASGVSEWVSGLMQLFVARDEVTWLHTREVPDEPVDAFLSLSCGSRSVPHILLDGVACAKALGVKFVAAAGPAGCCGKPYFGMGQFEAGEAFALNKIRYAQKIGATTTVTWCHACMQNVTTAAARREILEGKKHPLREVWIGNFLAERVAALGDRVPWKHRVSRRVLLDGHRESGAESDATDGMAWLLSLIPGVEIVGEIGGEPEVDGELGALRPCDTFGAAVQGSNDRPQWRRPQKDRQSADAMAARLADLVGARGADTVSSTHFACQNVWSRYGSDRMAVRNPVSILAEALGVAHPDRAQAAYHIGDPVEVVRQTRRIWESWDLTEDQALALATDTLYPLGDGPIGCSCDTHARDAIIPIDVLAGRSPGLTGGVAAQ